MKIVGHEKFKEKKINYLRIDSIVFFLKISNDRGCRGSFVLPSNWTRLTLSQTTNFRLVQTERVCRRQFQI